jgi:CheY-like chemotaxis protein
MVSVLWKSVRDFGTSHPRVRRACRPRAAVISLCALARVLRGRVDDGADNMAQPKKSPTRKSPPKPKAVEADEPLRICYVDDDVELTRMVSEALSDEGWEILTANDGEAGLELILSEQPDLILLDVMMPGLTGWEICKYIRSKPDWNGTPILMLTGIGERMNAMTAPLYGADAHLDKPFDIDELVETVRQLGAQALAE